MMRVVVGFIFNKGELLLIKHKRKNIWLPVGGHVEDGESDSDALKREIKEEVELEASISDKPFFTLKEENETTPHYICFSPTRKVKINLTEISDYKWLTKEDIFKFDLIEKVKNLSIKAFSILERCNS